MQVLTFFHVFNPLERDQPWATTSQRQVYSQDADCLDSGCHPEVQTALQQAELMRLSHLFLLHGGDMLP